MKQRLRDLPIARKLSLLLAFNTTIALVAIALVFSVGTAITSYSDARSQLTALSEVMGETSRAALAFDDREGARAVLEALRARLDISQATLTDRQGAVFSQVEFGTGHDHVGSLLESLVTQVFPAKLAVSQTIVDEGVAIGRIELQSHLYHIWIGVLKSLGLMVLIGMALASLAVHFGLRLRHIVVDPILGLADASHRVSIHQDYTIRAVKTGADEVGSLVDDFNHMLSEIQVRDEALRLERASLEQRVAQRTADLMKAVEEANLANRVKSEFLSTVSHELRTPLTAISGSIGLLVAGAMGPLPEPALNLLQIAQKNGRRLSYLIDDLLDVEKLMAGKLSFELEALPLTPLLEQALENNRAYADQFQVKLRLNTPAEPVVVQVDGQRLQQVLANLLSNAAKFSPPESEVCMSTQSLSGFVRVTVTDKGSGIPDTFRQHIFQKFSQADASDTKQKGGTGLGLAISRELIEQMGGRIGFESVQGQGSSFFFDVPVVAKMTPKETPA